MKTFVKIQIEVSSASETELLVASLSDLSFYAFDEENNSLNAYVTEEDFDEWAMQAALPPDTAYSKTFIREENWNRQWESDIQPVRVHDFVCIRPSFYPPDVSVRHDLIITPKMSFGTGHHATTHLMIELMEEIDLNNKRVIDFGTGTGVLAILAEKCGATEVMAIDYDEWSILNATENIEANFCTRVTLIQQDFLPQERDVDVILANINLNILDMHAVSLAGLAHEGTWLVMSGFLESDRAQIQKRFESQGFVNVKIKKAGDWLAMVFMKK